MLEWMSELEEKIKSDPLFTAIVADLHEIAGEMISIQDRLAQLEGKSSSPPVGSGASTANPPGQ